MTGPFPGLHGTTVLLVLSVALTMGAALPDLPAGTAGVAASSTPAAVGRDSASGRNATGTPAASVATEPGAAGPATGCGATDGSVRGHRDDVSAHPERGPSGTCPPGGPKRVHGPGRRLTIDGGATTAASVTATSPVSATGTTAKVAAARWSGEFNLYRKTAFVTQKDFTWCVAASVQMMVNIVRHRKDRSAATQQRMIRYAQASDHGPWGPGGGTDVTGWIAALRHFGAGRYRPVGARSAAAALRIAATAVRQTGRPAGMLVMDGRHAWVLHGFESRTDPRTDRHARITSVRVSGPLYPVQQKHGYDLRPNTELSVRALARFFHPSEVGALAGKYVVVVPVH